MIWSRFLFRNCVYVSWKVSFWKMIFMNNSLREKCPNTEVFLVRIFLYSDWIRRDTEYLLLRISPYSVRIKKNTDQKKLCIWTFFTVIAYSYGNMQNKPKRRCYKDASNQTYTLILLLSNTTINIFAKTTFEQIMVDFSINWLYKLIHHVNFSFGFQEVEIYFE